VTALKFFISDSSPQEDSSDEDSSSDSVSTSGVDNDCKQIV